MRAGCGIANRIIECRVCGLRPMEAVVLAASVAAVILLGSSVHRWMWAQAELVQYRSTMQELGSTVRGMRSRALAQRRTVQLRIDPVRGAFHVASVREQRGRTYETPEETIWLPAGLEISDAPERLVALPTGQFPSAAIVVAAPSYHKRFRLVTTESGFVHLHEESTL